MLGRICLATRYGLPQWTSPSSSRKVLVPRRTYVDVARLTDGEEFPPNWREQIKQELKPIHPPPTNDTDIIRETENVAQVKADLLKLKFVDMAHLGRWNKQQF